MTGAPAAIGHDGRGPFHHRLPVGIGHVGDQNIAVLDLVHLLDRGNVAHAARAHTLADRAAFDQHIMTGRIQLITLERRGVGFHGFGPGLQDEELAGLAVLAPFDIHRPAVVALDDQGLGGERFGIGVGEREPRLIGGVHVHELGGLAMAAIGGIDHLDGLAALDPTQDRRAPGIDIVLVDIELVGIDRALNHGLAQAPGAGDEDHLVETGFGIDGEHHTAGAGVGAHHALDAGRQGHLAVFEALVNAIRDRPIVEQGRKDILDRQHDVIQPADVEKRLLLAGERGVGQVFGRGRAAHGDRDILVAIGQRCKGLSNGVFEFGREGVFDDPVTDLFACGDQGIDVIDVKIIQRGIDLVSQAVVGQERAIGIGRGGKSVGHRDAGIGQMADHLAQRGVLAPDRFDVIHTELAEPDHLRVVHA